MLPTLFRLESPPIILLLFSLSSLVNAQQAHDIDVSGARPLNEALFEINNKYAQPIIYEEIAYEFTSYVSLAL